MAAANLMSLLDKGLVDFVFGYGRKYELMPQSIDIIKKIAVKIRISVQLKTTRPFFTLTGGSSILFGCLFMPYVCIYAIINKGTSGKERRTYIYCPKAIYWHNLPQNRRTYTVACI